MARRTRYTSIGTFVVLLLCLIGGANARGAEEALRLPAVIGDHMVLQQGRQLPIWGWSAPAAKVTIRIAGKTYDTIANDQGRWNVKLDPLSPAPEPLTMIVQASAAGQEDSALTVRDILVGEVWLCSGQSNMGMTLQAAGDTAAIQQANAPAIRLFAVPRTAATQPTAACSSQWQACTPETARAFSAAAYHFGRRLNQELNVPIGLVLSAWGGTAAESWISREGMLAEPILQAPLRKAEEDAHVAGQRPQKLTQDDSTWMASDFDDSTWKTINLPLYWDYVLYPVEYDGVIWARRTVEIPADWAGKELLLELDKVHGSEITYLNGQEVGRTTRHAPSPRRYTVPPALAKPGKALLAVRTNKVGWGGICGAKEKMRLGPVDGTGNAISLAGEWRYQPAELTFRNYSPRLPTSLYNGMIAPLVPYAIRGVIWYQGEANAYPDSARAYRVILLALIRDWRNRWGQGEFPFYFVQLPNFRAPVKDPNQPSYWAILRESQFLSLATVNTGMAVAIDIGEANDIHPKNKSAVGNRLALIALAKTYGKNIECSGPLYEGMTVEGETIRIRFAHAQGLCARNGTLAGFAIAGADRKFIWAEARIEGSTVVVSSAHVRQPLAVRYAWADNPQGANLYNQAELPASPFRTDDWRD